MFKFFSYIKSLFTNFSHNDDCICYEDITSLNIDSLPEVSSLTSATISSLRQALQLQSYLEDHRNFYNY